MKRPTNPDIAKAYNAVSAQYDTLLLSDTWIREIVHKTYSTCFKPCMHILDLGCGTGTDSIFLAKKGIKVTAIDIAPLMIEKLQKKIKDSPHKNNIIIKVLDINKLDQLPGEQYDGFVSGYAAMNTIENLSHIAATLYKLLKPGSHAVLHMLNPFCVWDWLSLVRQRKFKLARELQKRRVIQVKIAEKQVTHYLDYPGEIYSTTFQPYFDLKNSFAIGCFSPLQKTSKIPQPLIRLLSFLENKLSSYRPFLNMGRFFVLHMIRKEESDS